MEVKKGICLKCRELKILNSEDICISCSRHVNSIGIEVKRCVNENIIGTEIKSISGSITA